MNTKTLLLLLPLLIDSSSTTLIAQGFLTGDSGGNEREVTIFDRDFGMVWHTVTGVSGRFESKTLPEGEYLAVSGSVITPVKIQSGLATEILFSSQKGMSADTETWSPSRKKFGQTFKAVGPWVNGFRFWNPGKPVQLIAELRERDPKGKLVGRKDLGECSWIKIINLQPWEWPTDRGHNYYLSLHSPTGSTFQLGTPALGDTYIWGNAYYDDEPRLDSDMGFSISQDNDNLKTIVRVTLHQGFGFKSEGPASGSPTWAAQSFTATTNNLRTVWINAGWPSSEGLTKRFIFSVHEKSPTGKQVGPERNVLMIKDWGATCAWFRDQVPLRKGEKYIVKLRRVDGKPFYAYLAPDLYKKGEALRNKLSTENLDLTCILKGEEHPGSVVLPMNVRMTQITARSITVKWETALPTTSQISFGNRGFLQEKYKTQHVMTLPGLDPGTSYTFQVGGRTENSNSPPLYSKSVTVKTLEDPTSLLPKNQVMGITGKLIPLKNSSFEDGLKGWKVSSLKNQVAEVPLPPDVKNLRSVYYLGRYHAHSGKRVLGWNHKVHEKSGPIPRKMEPALTRTVSQVVTTIPGKIYTLSAWVLTDERQGGWNRNDRVRLIVDPTHTGKLDHPETVDNKFVTQWYSTRGQWKRFRLKFKAQNSKTAIGVQLYQWWLLAENHVYVDDVKLYMND